MSTLIQITKPTELIVNNTPIIGGVAGRVLFQGTGNVLQQSSSLFWDATNSRLGIGTSTPTNTITIGQAVASALQSSAAGIFTSNESASNVFVQVAASNDPVQRPVFAGTRSRGTLLIPTAVQSGDAITTFLSQAFDGTAGQASAGLSFDAESNASSGNAPQLISFITGASGATRTTKMQVRSNGNVLIGTTTDAGFKLDVNGTARVQGNTTIGGTITISSSGDRGLFTWGGGYFGIQALGNQGISLILTNNTRPLNIPNATGNVLINTTTDAGYKLDVNGTARVTNLTVNNSILGQGSAQSLVFNNGTGITTLSDNIGIQLNLNSITYFSLRSSASGGTNRFLMIGNAAGNLPAQPDSCAVLQLYSTNAGFLPPRMTTTQKNAIASPAAGLVVYDTTLNKLCVYTTTWETVTSL